MRTACDSPLDGPIVQGLAVAVLWSVAIVAGMLRQGDAGFLLAVMRPIAGVALIPAVWMLFQAIPLNNSELARGEGTCAGSA